LFFGFKHCFNCKKHNSGASNIVLALQTLFFGLKQNLDGSNIVFSEKTMFEGMGRKNSGPGDEIREKPRNFTGLEAHQRKHPAWTEGRQPSTITLRRRR
jgi:hypothetical protein